MGEIGKLLQECTGNDTLSATIKNNYKGLKKLVEGYRYYDLSSWIFNISPAIFSNWVPNTPSTPTFTYLTTISRRLDTISFTKKYVVFVCNAYTVSYRYVGEAILYL